ncbi:hypothetical protein K8T06_03035, partial [bacterium]|nr:hypothetical protein [bacterium]
DGDLLTIAIGGGNGSPGTCQLFLFDSLSGDQIWQDTTDSHWLSRGVVRSLQISSESRYISGPYRPSITPGESWMLLYDLQSSTADDPLWIAKYHDLSQYGFAEMARDAGAIIANASTTVQFHDFSPPVENVKEPLWEAFGDGYWGLGSTVAISDDGSIAAYHGAGLDSTDGHARVYDTAGSVEIFHETTLFKDPSVNVAGNGSRIAFSGDMYDYHIDDGRTYIWDSSQNEFICELNTFGCLAFDYSGNSLFIGSGRDELPRWAHLSFFKIEDNEPPTCQIVSPSEGDIIAGTVLLTGLADDSDSELELVEIVSPAGVHLAEPVGSELNVWQVDIDLTDVETGDAVFMARSVDDSFKHGSWDEITLTIAATPTPMPSATPEPTNTPEPTSTPNSRFPLVMNLLIPTTHIVAGELFSLNVEIQNTDQPFADASLYVLLEIHGILFAAPSWAMLDGTNPVDHLVLDIYTGHIFVNIIPEFVWPETGTHDEGLGIYGVIFSQEFRMISNLDLVIWDYGTMP